MSSEKVTLTLLPVCKCGYVFKDKIILHRQTMEIDKSGYIKQQQFFEPATCPNCKRVIDCIQYMNLIEER